MHGSDACANDRLYAFGSFIADPAAGGLRRDGVSVPLTLKSLVVLVALIERRGHVVEKDELLKLVWPDTIVEENNLARHISMLRKALDDHSREHPFIVTVPGRGYRFVGAVRELSRVDVPSPPAALPAARSRIVRLASSRAAALTSLALAVAIITSIVILADYGNSASEPPERKLWQLTSAGGLESNATWSPDSQAIAYSSDRGGNFDIWTQAIDDGQPVRLTSSPAHDWQPAWSPDGRRIAFRSERDGGGLFTVSASGGEERRITNLGYRPQWSPREPRLLFDSSNTVRSRLYVVGANGEQLRRVLVEFLDEFSSFRASWHPDGKRISVYGTHRTHGPSFWTTPVDGGAPIRSDVSAKVLKRLKKTRGRLLDFSWSPSGDALYFEGQSEEAVNIWRVRVDPLTLQWREGPERLTTGGGFDTNIVVSPNGRKLAFTIRSERTRLWSFPFDSLNGQMLGDGQPVSARGADALYPDVPQDGTQVVYRTTRRGKQELWKRSLVDGQERMLTSAGEILAPRWSNDGKQLAFGRILPDDGEGSGKKHFIVLISADGRDERLLTTPGPKQLAPTDWSADGAWIVGACEYGPLGHRSVCMLPVASAPHAEEHMRIVASDPERNLYQATVSPNTRWIGFNAAGSISDSSTIYVVSTQGGQWTSITEGTFWDDKPRWSPDGRTIYFVSNRSGFLNVWARRFNPETGKPSGDPFRVTNFENPSECVSSPFNTMDLALTPHDMILPIVEASGAVWVLEGIDR